MPVDQAEVTVEFHGGPFDGERRMFGMPEPLVRIRAPVVASMRDGVPTVDFDASWEAEPSGHSHMYQCVIDDGPDGTRTKYLYRGTE